MKKIIRSVAIIFILIAAIAGSANAAALLVPGGQLIGLQLQDDRVTVAAFDETLGGAARNAGLREGDQILRIDEHPICCAEDVRKALQCSDGQVDVSVLRGTKTKELTVAPQVTEEGPRLGVYLRQGTAGVGTVTYYDPQSKNFAALGHGVNTQSGGLLQLTQGSVYEAMVQSVKKGSPGTPGQLMGAISGQTPLGSLRQNTDQGVFGSLDAGIGGIALPVAAPGDAHTGTATIRSTVDGNALREYSVEILKIYPNSPERTRNMLIKVTDPDLLETTGGIVQGMSGSPILQDGRIVGAVTHVLVNDPTTGYGIFIENMLEAAS